MNSENLTDRLAAQPEGDRITAHDIRTAGLFLDTIGDRHQFLLLPDHPQDKKDGAKPITVWATTWAEAHEQIVVANLGVFRPEVGRVVKYGAYFTLCETKNLVRRKGKMGRARVVCADFDIKDGHTLPEKFPLEPFAQVFSGNGWHLYWRVRDCTAAQMVTANKNIAAAMNSDTAVAKETQVMRIPGLLNNKSDKPKKSHIIDIGDATEHTPEEITQAFGERRRSAGAAFLASDPPISAAEVEAIPLTDRIQWCTERLDAVHDIQGNDAWRVAVLGHDFGVPQTEFFPVFKRWAAADLTHRRSRTPFDDFELAQYVTEAYAYAQREFGCEAVKRSEAEALVRELCGNFAPPVNAPICLSRSETTGGGVENAPPVNAPICLRRPETGGGSVGGVPLAQPILARDLEAGSVTRIELKPGFRVSENMNAAVNFDGSTGVVTFVRAPMGSGKTHWAVERAAHFETLLAVAPLVSLVHGLAGRFDCEAYSEEGARSSDRVATTLKSLPKVEQDPRKTFPDTKIAREFVVLDEIDQLNGFHFSGLLDSPSQAKQHLIWAVAAAAQSVITSADLTDRMIDLYVDLLRDMRPDLRFVIATQPPPKKADRVVQLCQVGFAKSELFNAIDDWRPGDLPIAVCCTSRAWPEEFARAVRLRRRAVRSQWFSSRNSKQPAVQDALRTPDEILADCDVLIISPSVQSGVSFDRPVQRVFVLQTFDGVLGTTVCQMAMRFRHVEDPRIVWGIKSWRGEGDRPTDDLTLRRLSVGYAKKTDDVVATAAIDYELSFDRGRRPTDPGLQRMWVVHTAAQNAMFNDPVGETVAAMLRHGWHVIDDRWREPDVDCLAVWKQVLTLAKQRADDEHIRAILEAECLTFDELEKVEGQAAQTAEEAAAVDKTKIRDFYGRDPDMDLVERDDRGKWRKRVRMYNDVRHFLDPEGMRFLTWREANDVQGKTAAEYRHRLLKADLMSDLYLAITVRSPAMHTDDRPPDRVSLTSADAQRIAMHVHERRSEDFRFLYRSTLHDPEKAVAWLNAQARRMGAEVESTRGTDGGRTYHYDFSQAHRDGEHDREGARAAARAIRDHGDRRTG